jgi:hypothetical protein
MRSSARPRRRPASDRFSKPCSPAHGGPRPRQCARGARSRTPAEGDVRRAQIRVLPPNVRLELVPCHNPVRIDISIFLCGLQYVIGVVCHKISATSGRFAVTAESQSQSLSQGESASVAPTFHAYDNGRVGQESFHPRSRKSSFTAWPALCRSDN